MSDKARQFKPKLITVLKEGYGLKELQKDAVAGATVGVVALPLSMAIAIACGLPPETGLITAIVGGITVSALGGQSVSSWWASWGLHRASRDDFGRPWAIGPYSCNLLIWRATDTGWSLKAGPICAINPKPCGVRIFSGHCADHSGEPIA
jgi:hypothetical protein